MPPCCGETRPLPTLQAGLEHVASRPRPHFDALRTPPESHEQTAQPPPAVPGKVLSRVHTGLNPCPHAGGPVNGRSQPLHTAFTTLSHQRGSNKHPTPLKPSIHAHSREVPRRRTETIHMYLNRRYTMLRGFHHEEGGRFHQRARPSIWALV